MTRSKKSKWLPRNQFKKKQSQAPAIQLIAIPSDILWSIFSDWICVVELCCLDSAYCSRKHRQPFLSLLSAGEFLIDTSVCSLRLSKWLITRSISCSCIKLDFRSLFASESTDSLVVNQVLLYINEHLTCAKSIFLTNIPENPSDVHSILLAIVGSCQRLEKLAINDSYILSELPASYCLDQLQALNLTNCTFIAEKLNLGLLAGSKLREFTVHTSKIATWSNNGTQLLINDKAVYGAAVCSVIKKNLTSLTSITISRADDNIVSCIASNCGDRLRALDLTVQFMSSTECLDLLFDKCTGLTSISLPGSTKVLNSSVIKLAIFCVGLVKVELNGCTLLTDISVIALSRRCRGLQVLSVKFCNRLTDEAMVSLGNKSSKTLTEVYLDGCKELTDVGVLHLVENCKILRKISVSGCKLLSDMSYIAISMMN